MNWFVFFNVIVLCVSMLLGAVFLACASDNARTDSHWWTLTYIVLAIISLAGGVGFIFR